MRGDGKEVSMDRLSRTYFELTPLHICLPSPRATTNGRTPRFSPLTTSRAITMATRGILPLGPVGGIHLSSVNEVGTMNVMCNMQNLAHFAAAGRGV